MIFYWASMSLINLSLMNSEHDLLQSFLEALRKHPDAQQAYEQATSRFLTILRRPHAGANFERKNALLPPQAQGFPKRVGVPGLFLPARRGDDDQSLVSRDCGPYVRMDESMGSYKFVKYYQNGLYQAIYDLHVALTDGTRPRLHPELRIPAQAERLQAMRMVQKVAKLFAEVHAGERESVEGFMWDKQRGVHLHEDDIVLDEHQAFEDPHFAAKLPMASHAESHSRRRSQLTRRSTGISWDIDDGDLDSSVFVVARIANTLSTVNKSEMHFAMKLGDEFVNDPSIEASKDIKSSRTSLMQLLGPGDESVKPQGPPAVSFWTEEEAEEFRLTKESLEKLTASINVSTFSESLSEVGEWVHGRRKQSMAEEKEFYTLMKEVEEQEVEAEGASRSVRLMLREKEQRAESKLQRFGDALHKIKTKGKQLNALLARYDADAVALQSQQTQETIAVLESQIAIMRARVLEADGKLASAVPSKGENQEIEDKLRAEQSRLDLASAKVLEELDRIQAKNAVLIKQVAASGDVLHSLENIEQQVQLQVAFKEKAREAYGRNQNQRLEMEDDDAEEKENEEDKGEEEEEQGDGEGKDEGLIEGASRASCESSSIKESSSPSLSSEVSSDEESAASDEEDHAREISELETLIANAEADKLAELEEKEELSRQLTTRKHEFESMPTAMEREARLVDKINEVKRLYDARKAPVVDKAALERQAQEAKRLETAKQELQEQVQALEERLSQTQSDLQEISSSLEEAQDLLAILKVVSIRNEIQADVERATSQLQDALARGSNGSSQEEEIQRRLVAASEQVALLGNQVSRDRAKANTQRHSIQTSHEEELRAALDDMEEMGKEVLSLKERVTAIAHEAAERASHNDRAQDLLRRQQAVHRKLHRQVTRLREEVRLNAADNPSQRATRVKRQIKALELANTKLHRKLRDLESQLQRKQIQARKRAEARQAAIRAGREVEPPNEADQLFRDDDETRARKADLRKQIGKYMRQLSRWRSVGLQPTGGLIPRTEQIANGGLRPSVDLAEEGPATRRASMFFEEKISRAVEVADAAARSPRVYFAGDEFVADENMHPRFSLSDDEDEDDDLRVETQVDADARGQHHKTDGIDVEEEEIDDDDDQEPIWRGNAEVSRHLLGQGMRMVTAAEAEADPALLDHAIELLSMAIGEAPNATLEARAFQALAMAFEQSPVRQVVAAAPLLEKSANLFLKAGEREQATAAVLRLIDDLLESGNAEEALRVCRDFSLQIPDQPLLSKKLVDLVIELTNSET
ncbi:Hypothetical Protein FCC1311_024902 [Hondaea fermentalgiana]|uniref:Uncharacterized protein n=1 Tax=Hondaea fermentalgiana TaxID=2315210 RepID=A0A2R5G7G1_9STRA|nr:Hypothetical Protein FCC1311_024902 [Hondaea fermentalgiana]|eukprot:GBG26269.1 Hypothetical Protein FCC1311_024902 [Hondaea fermentalgiana]